MVKLLILNKMEIKTKTKLIRYLILIWFSLQAVFMFFWPIYLYYKNGFKFYEMFALGCLILLSSISTIVNKNLVRKIAICFLWVYSISFAVFGTLSNLVASPKPMLALVLTFIMIVNIVLLLLKFYYYSMTYCDR